ncbi:MAG: signal peptidase I [Deltaproteobacteria bacterium]|nr:signal peptidase I [Deltaproteobacteria bacterium]
MVISSPLRKFFLPKITKRYLIRISMVALFSYIFFSFVCTPFRIKGHSMAPTYMDGRFNFCFKLRYIFSRPERGDIVAIRLAGESVMLLKRVVALEGDVVEFRNGDLFVNERKIEEDYSRYPSEWNLAPRKVNEGNVYVVGDNRGVSIDIHRFGQTPADRIVGSPLW